jgi:hypothetical protein
MALLMYMKVHIYFLRKAEFTEIGNKHNAHAYAHRFIVINLFIL